MENKIKEIEDFLKYEEIRMKKIQEKPDYPDLPAPTFFGAWVQGRLALIKEIRDKIKEN